MDRRDFMRVAGSGALAATVGASALSGSAAAVTTSQIKPSDGFADVGSWLENSDPDIYRIQNATRSEVEEAFHASGPRIVVFETSGTINLGGEPLKITEDKCWVAGQTAPSPGITFTEGLFQIDANDCVVQHIRSRCGPGSDGDIQGNDAINTQDETTNNVVDHCTASWGVDECMSVGYDTDRTTYTNNFIYEGLAEWDHHYCTLVGDGSTNVTLAGNFWAKARSRIPRLKSDTSSVVVNNFAYFMDEMSNTDGSAETTWVGNKYAGLLTTGEPVVEGSGTVYSEDNITEPTLDSDVSFVGDPDQTSSKPLWPSGLSPMSSSQTEEYVLSNAGARPADRTANDERIVQEARERAGDGMGEEYYLGTHEDAGGYPELPENTHSLSVPSSGLREWLGEWSAKVETGSGDIGGGDNNNGSTGDSTAPSTPSGVWSTGTTASSVDLQWNAASDSGGSGLSHYFVTVGDQQQQVAAGSTSTTVTGLDVGTSYQASVQAVDGEGNRSGTATTSVTTAQGDDSNDSQPSGDGSHFRPEDGFADIDWFDDDVEVIKVGADFDEIRAAFTKDSKRLIVFEESGVVDLQGADMSITYGNCWVAGQTAPSPGITFINGMIQVEQDNTVVQHIRVLRGDKDGGEGTDPMNSRDGANNVIFDHCSVFWGRDENLSVGYDSNKTTLSNCLSTEGLEDPEENSNGSLIGDGADNVAILGTIYAKNNDRNPRIKDDARVALVNSLTYYFDKAAWMSSGSEASVVGNAYVGRFDWSDAIVWGDGSAYFEDNHVTDPGLEGRDFQNVSTVLDSKPLWPDGLEALPSRQAEAHALANAGARPGDRIDHEERVIQDIAERRMDVNNIDPSGSVADSEIPDSREDVGGYPTHGGSTRNISVPDSGIREWLRQESLRVSGEYEPPESDDQAPDTPSQVSVTNTSYTSVDVSWNAVTDNGPSGVDHYKVYADGTVATTVPSDTTSATVDGLDEGTQYEIGVSAVDGWSNESGQGTATATTESYDVDRTNGYGPITVEGAGEDIWNEADEFHYYYATAGGDFDVAVNVASIEDTNEYAKAGLMVRESMDDDAQNVMIRKTPSATSVQWRSSAGSSSTSLTSDDGESESEVDGGTTSDSWQRLAKSGDTIRAYSSSDGQNWTLLAELSMSFSDSARIGLAVTSHSSGTLCTAEFENYTSPRNIFPSQSQDVGDVDASGTVDDQGDQDQIDTEAPSRPASVWSTGATQSSIDVSWNAASDSGGSGLAEYVVYVDGQQRTTVGAGTTSATISGLQTDTQYDIGVAAVDGQGNESSQAMTTATTGSGVSGGQTISPSFSMDSVGVDGSAEATITLDSAPEGLAGFDLTVSVDDTSVATIDSASYGDGLFNQGTEVSGDGSSVTLQAIDASESIQSGATNVELASVSLQAQGAGDTTVSVTVEALDADGGAPMSASTTTDTLSVTETTLSEVEGVIPQDLDGDGTHEDLNANDRLDSDDVVVFFNNYDNPAITDHVDAYDFNGNSNIDFDDIVQLFNEL